MSPFDFSSLGAFHGHRIGEIGMDMPQHSCRDDFSSRGNCGPDTRRAHPSWAKSQSNRDCLRVEFLHDVLGGLPTVPKPIPRRGRASLSHPRCRSRHTKCSPSHIASARHINPNTCHPRAMHITPLGHGQKVGRRRTTADHQVYMQSIALELSFRRHPSQPILAQPIPHNPKPSRAPTCPPRPVSRKTRFVKPHPTTN